jgi:nucleoid DNA-binding protein
MKPASMTLKEWLIKKLALDQKHSEKNIKVVIDNQFDTANDAVNKHDSVELSGFGKFVFNKNRAIKRLAKWKKEKAKLEEAMKENMSERRKLNMEDRIFVLDLSIKVLHPRITKDENK